MNEGTKIYGLRVSSAVLLAPTQDGAVLLDVDQGLCFSLNMVGTLIWNEINTGSNPEQISRHLSNTFGISVGQAQNDLEEFLAALKEKKLLEAIGDNTAPAAHGFLQRIRLLGRRNHLSGSNSEG